MRAHRSVDAAGNVIARRIGDRGVQLFTHAVQALEFKCSTSRVVIDVADGMGIMGGKLRIDVGTVREQVTGASKIGNVGIAFQGEYRIIRQPLFLGPLDLHVPIGALDQADGNNTFLFISKPVETFQQGQGAFLVGLYSQAQPRPVAQVGMAV